MKIIQSVQNEQIKHLGKLLNQSKARRIHQQTVLEGIHLIQAYLDSGQLPKCLYIPMHKQTNAEVINLIQAVPENICIVVADDVLKKISQLSLADDLMALIEIPKFEVIPNQGDCVVLDAIQDPGNMGTVLRSAVAAGINKVILGNGCVDVFSPKVLRAGMGAHFDLELFERVDLIKWCEAYQNRILATALTEKQLFSLYDIDLSEPSAWVFGNEGQGISPAILAKADMGIRIPMLGNIESLNIAMAATVCLFEQMRQRL